MKDEVLNSGLAVLLFQVEPAHPFGTTTQMRTRPACPDSTRAPRGTWVVYNLSPSLQGPSDRAWSLIPSGSARILLFGRTSSWSLGTTFREYCRSSCLPPKGSQQHCSRRRLWQHCLRCWESDWTKVPTWFGGSSEIGKHMAKQKSHETPYLFGCKQNLKGSAGENFRGCRGSSFDPFMGGHQSQRLPFNPS